LFVCAASKKKETSRNHVPAKDVDGCTGSWCAGAPTFVLPDIS
jgi:hypothetical protein